MQATGSNGQVLEDLKERILAHLLAGSYCFDVESDARGEQILGTTAPDNYGDTEAVRIQKVAVVHVEGFIPIHIMVTDACVSDLLRNFDISTHQVAILHSGRRYEGPDFTRLDEEPITLKHTPATPARLKKIRNRYATMRVNG